MIMVYISKRLDRNTTAERKFYNTFHVTVFHYAAKIF